MPGLVDAEPRRENDAIGIDVEAVAGWLRAILPLPPTRQQIWATWLDDDPHEGGPGAAHSLVEDFRDEFAVQAAEFWDPGESPMPPGTDADRALVRELFATEEDFAAAARSAVGAAAPRLILEQLAARFPHQARVIVDTLADRDEEALRLWPDGYVLQATRFERIVQRALHAGPTTGRARGRESHARRPGHRRAAAARQGDSGDSDLADGDSEPAAPSGVAG